MKIELQRVYGDGSRGDHGYRVLVDRLWPRGISKETLHPDEWMKDLAPSDSLRKWFGHDPARWEEFRRKYLDELKGRKQDLDRLRALAGKKPLVLLYSAKDEAHNQAIVLREALLERTS